jgi:hypothetical protein
LAALAVAGILLTGAATAVDGPAADAALAQSSEVFVD